MCLGKISNHCRPTVTAVGSSRVTYSNTRVMLEIGLRGYCASFIFETGIPTLPYRYPINLTSLTNFTAVISLVVYCNPPMTSGIENNRLD